MSDFNFDTWVKNLPTETEFDLEIYRIELERSKRGKEWLAQKERDELSLRTPKVRKVVTSGVLG